MFLSLALHRLNDTVYKKHEGEYECKKASPFHDLKMGRVMTAILQNKPMINPELGKAIDIPSEPPQVQNQESNTPEHRKDVIHGINLILVIIKLDKIKDNQDHEGA